MAHNGTLTAGQNRALRALLTATSVREAAEVASLSERTVWRYLSEASFRRELRRRQDHALSGITSHLVGLSEEAVSTLREVMLDSEESGSVRVRAALGWLRFVRDAVELESLSDRVRILESSLQKN